MKLFQTTEPVPDNYEVVSVAHNIHKRDAFSPVSIMIQMNYEKNITLYLEPSDHILFGNETKVWSAVPNSTYSGGIKYEVISNFHDSLFGAYQNDESAVLISRNRRGDTVMNGMLNDSLWIQPLPSKLVNIFSGKHRRKREDANNLTYTVPHLIYKVSSTQDSVENNTLKRIIQRKKRTVNSSSVDAVYPEIIIFIDRTLFRSFEENVERVKEYVVSFWNAVDLRYRYFEDPKIRLNIAGIIISMGNMEVPFIEENIRQDSSLHATKCLYDLGVSLKNNEQFNFTTDYDIFMVMTKLDACYTKDLFGYTSATRNSCDILLKGLSRTRGACLKDVNKINSVGIFEDNGGFNGIHTAVHELGHLLGSQHYKRGRFSIRKENFIMDPYIDNSLPYPFWSPDSQISINLFLKQNVSSCLRNKPNIGIPLRPLLPGLFATMDKQCQKYENGSQSCTPLYDCQVLYCNLTSTNVCKKTVPVAEGTSCGDSNICLNGKCTSKTALPTSYLIYILQTKYKSHT